MSQGRLPENATGEAHRTLERYSAALAAAADSHFPSGYVAGVSPSYLSRKLTRPLPTKDGGTLRTVLDARAYMLALSKQRARQGGNGNGRPNCCLARPTVPPSASR